MSTGTVFPAQELQLGDTRFGYRACGQSGPQVVLLHGISSGAASWAACAAALAAQARVMAWDAPGYGVSTPLSVSAPDAMAYAQQLARLLDALKIDRCILVGHSLGVLMAAAFSQWLPDRVQALLLFSPAIGYGGGPRAAAVREGRLEGLRQGIPAMAEKLPARLLSAGASAEQRQQVRDVAMQLHKTGYAQAVEMLCAEDLNRYRHLPFLTRVYCGEHDVVTTPEQSRVYAEKHDLAFGLISGAGHACHVEQPLQLARQIAQIAEHVGDPGAGVRA